MLTKKCKFLRYKKASKENNNVFELKPQLIEMNIDNNRR